MASIKRHKTSRGTRYQVRWRVDDKSVERWVKTDREAKALKAQIEGDAIAGLAFDPRRGRLPMNVYFDEWLRTRLVKGRPLAGSTRVGYRRLWTRVVEKQIGHKDVIAIARDDIRRWHAGTVEIAGTSQAAKAYRLVRAVLNTAYDDDLIRQNPCHIKGAGQEHSDERPIVDTKLVLDLMDAITEERRAIVALAGFVGLRTGESLGLRRRDVNLLHAELSVKAQSQELEGGQRFLEHTKSDAGRRVLSLPRVVIDALDYHLANYAEPDADALLFTGPQRKNPHLRGPLRRATLSLAWQGAKAATNAPENLRLHDLRHHALTVAARMPGITTKELMARGGHSSPRAALIYQHATAERDRAISAFLDAQVAEAEITRGAGVWLQKLAGQETPANVEAATGIEPVYGALQAPA